MEQLNRIVADDFPYDDKRAARTKSYELAFHTQSAVPDAVDLSAESERVSRLYGLDKELTKVAGQRLPAARRLVERGVRFVQVFPSAYGTWECQHRNSLLTSDREVPD